MAAGSFGRIGLGQRPSHSGPPRKGALKDKADLPTGTVTFLFSDIEGSTRLLQSLGDRYPDVPETHERLLRQALRAAGVPSFRLRKDGSQSLGDSGSRSRSDVARALFPLGFQGFR